MKLFKNISIKNKLLIIILLISSFALIAGMASVIIYTSRSIKQEMINNTAMTARLMSEYCVMPLDFGYRDAAQEILEKLQSIPTISAGIVYDKEGEVFASYAKSGQQTVAPPIPQSGALSEFDRNYLHVFRPITFEGQRYGTIYLGASTEQINKKIRDFRLNVLLLLIGLIALIFAVAIWVQKIISVPILELARATNTISKEGDYSLRVNKPSRDEIGVLYEGFNEMLQQIQLRDDNLAHTLENLRKTQKQLVESEKMAALGGLVAGVAHEINTPLGVSVGAASHLETETKGFQTASTSGQLKKSTLNNYLKTALESSSIILSNLKRAAGLVQSFKQVSVDQQSEEKRVFKLKAYLEDIIRSLHNKLKQTNQKVTIECDEELTLNSYPGVFSQIVTNLVMNSLIHAYEKDQEGVIRINVETKGSMLKMEYSDDGRGMKPEVREKIFEPFFTTARNQGGSGLGMHIVFNLVTQKLGGTIACKSEPGRGTEILLEIPVEQENTK